MQPKQVYYGKHNSVGFLTFIKDFAGALEVDEDVAKIVYFQFIKIIAEYLRQGKTVYLFHFGIFRLQILPPTTNVTKTGEKIHMKERKIVRFKASETLKKLFYNNRHESNG